MSVSRHARVADLSDERTVQARAADVVKCARVQHHELDPGKPLSERAVKATVAALYAASGMDPLRSALLEDAATKDQSIRQQQRASKARKQVLPATLVPAYSKRLKEWKEVYETEHPKVVMWEVPGLKSGNAVRVESLQDAVERFCDIFAQPSWFPKPSKAPRDQELVISWTFDGTSTRERKPFELQTGTFRILNDPLSMSYKHTCAFAVLHCSETKMDFAAPMRELSAMAAELKTVTVRGKARVVRQCQLPDEKAGHLFNCTSGNASHFPGTACKCSVKKIPKHSDPDDPSTWIEATTSRLELAGYCPWRTELAGYGTDLGKVCEPRTMDDARACAARVRAKCKKETDSQNDWEKALFDTDDRRHTKLMKFVREHTHGQVSDPLFGHIPFEYRFRDVFHLGLHLVNAFKSFVWDIADAAGVWPALADALIQCNLRAIRVPKDHHKHPMIAHGEQHAHMQGPEAAFFRRNFAQVMLPIFEGCEKVHACLKKGIGLLNDLLGGLLSCDWHGIDHSFCADRDGCECAGVGHLRKKRRCLWHRVRAYLDWMLDDVNVNVHPNFDSPGWTYFEIAHHNLIHVVRDAEFLWAQHRIEIGKVSMQANEAINKYEKLFMTGRSNNHMSATNKYDNRLFNGLHLLYRGMFSCRLPEDHPRVHMCKRCNGIGHHNTKSGCPEHPEHRPQYAETDFFASVVEDAEDAAKATATLHGDKL